jgi:Opioid growth factor receptor (OGFr) conserved region
MLNSPIIGFYSGTEPDHRGRHLREIQHWPDEQLESVHDYIQWLFPLPERSGFNVAAPVLNPESIQGFRTRADLQENLRVSFLRMMSFYGLELRAGVQITVTRAPNFATKATNWLSPGNHNHLRITRILRCLTVLGLEPEAKAFFGCLAEIYGDEQNKPLPAISDETMAYWRRAAGDAGSG